MTIVFSEILDTLAQGADLTMEQAESAFAQLMDGELSLAQAGAFLMGLRAKGETANELASGVKAALGRARTVDGLTGRRIDTCGTGGDGSCSFNCSTAVAMTLAGMGHQVVKHGNRAVSSNCGSADAIEAMGMPLADGPDAVREQLAAKNFAFLFAPNFHPAFKHVMPVRTDLGIRTLFNLMGPLLNPARPTHQLLGVAKAEILDLMAQVLLLTGVERAAVVHGAGGFDELTPFGPATVAWVADGNVVRTQLDPATLGFATHTPADVAVGGKDEAVATLREVLAGKGPQAMRDMLALNLAMCLHLIEDDLPLTEAADKARGAVGSGLGLKVMEG